MAIAFRSTECLRHFEYLLEYTQLWEGQSPLQVSTIGDELGRFKIWAGNVGALQRDSRSLDYRLREASQIRDQVVRILKDLDFSLHECTEILSGRRAQKFGCLSDDETFNDGFSDISDSDESENPAASAGEREETVSELSQLLLAIIEAIASLYKLSIATRNPTPWDRYAKSASLAPFDSTFDVGHVHEKFPHLRSKVWLMERLGKAITKRREFLRYRSEHREKIGGSIGPSTDLSERHEMADAPGKVASNDAHINTGASVAGDEADSVSYGQIASTKVATYAANPSDENTDTRSTASRSEASYVSSILEESWHSLREIPEPPKESANGKPFECPYCFMVLTIKNIKLWRKHVLSDLRPYLCTFEGCSSRMFESRHEWFQHELGKHRKEWHCCLCSERIPFSSAAQLQLHLSNEHTDHSKQQTSALLALCEKPLESIPHSACPFCAWYPWNPYRVLDVSATDPHSTCVGTALSTGRRCRWGLVSRQFDTHQIVAAVKALESMSRMDPSMVTNETLCSLARNTLCRYHQSQEKDKCHQWKAEIQHYLHKRSGRDDDVRHSPGSREHSKLPPTVMLTSLEFERHVGHHLEQLALFALPPPMKESSEAFSNQAAASDKSDPTARSDAMSVLSFASVHTREKNLELSVPLNAVLKIQRNFRRRRVSDAKAGCAEPSQQKTSGHPTGDMVRFARLALDIVRKAREARGE